MDQHEYNQLCIRFKGKLAEFKADFIDLALLLSAIRLLADHPDFAEYGIVLRGKLGDIREGILAAYQELGLTTSQIHALDTMYASDAYERSHDEAAPGTRDKSHLRILDPQEAEKIREEIDATADRLSTFLNEEEKEDLE